MKLFEIEQFRKRLRLYINVLGAATSFMYALFQAFLGDYHAVLNTSIAFVYFLLILYYLLVKNRYLWRGRGFVLLISIVILNIIIRDPDHGVYWIYVGIISIFLLTDAKSAIIGAIGFITIALYLVTSAFQTDVLIRIYSTVLVSALLVAFFSYLLENLLHRMKSMIIHDPLTGILNRNSFDDFMQGALDIFFRYETPAFLLLFDIDHFKKINDDNGHQVGDDVLVKMCHLVSNRLRQSDRFFRYGGEEFAVILNHTDKTEAMTFARDIKDVVEQANFANNIKITISIGGAEAQKSDAISSWLSRCDASLYQAKATGRNKIVFY